jgi:hypothetical protein
MLQRIVDIVAITAATAIVGVLGWHAYSRFDHQREIKHIPVELRRFEQVLAFQSASGQTQINTRGWPVTIEPQWFNGDPPRNNVVSQDRPWLEIATPEQADLSDPVIRMTIDRSLAAFWYNPYRGIVRARVPMQIRDDRSLAMYNSVNGTSLASIHGRPVDPLPAGLKDQPGPSLQDQSESDDLEFETSPDIASVDDLPAIEAVSADEPPEDDR